MQVSLINEVEPRSLTPGQRSRSSASLQKAHEDNCTPNFRLSQIRDVLEHDLKAKWHEKCILYRVPVFNPLVTLTNYTDEDATAYGRMTMCVSPVSHPGIPIRAVHKFFEERIAGYLIVRVCCSAYI
jgi:hypothetical protein